jgi:prepilin-type N-terminal cleavage/methylation domain-containing protein
MFNNIKKAAFTLAEVMITLGIIGVVAAMTIPNLMNEYREQVWGTTLKKNYSTMVTMCERMLAEENVSNANETKLYAALVAQNSTNIQTALSQYLKLKNPAAWYSGFGYTSHSSYRYTAPDGAFVYITYYNSSYPFYISIDVNANEMPNTVGQDRFAYMLDRKCNYQHAISNTFTENFRNVTNNNWRIPD